MQTLQRMLTNYTDVLHIPAVGWTDIVEILIIAVLVYYTILWVKNTRAYSLLKGFLFIIAFVVLAALFNMTTILWIVQNVTSIAVIALIVILQPELRTAMEELGQKNIFAALFREGSRGGDGLFSDKTISEIVRACVAMARVKTGALIVIRQNTPLREWERTGIDLDAVVSSQLLINIFEKNTPLHDGAVIVRGNRVTSATCYLPLSDNMALSKDLGTRHRAGVGISEATDSMTVIVSEETGKISVAYGGNLDRNLSGDALKEKLKAIQNKPEEETKKRILWKGRSKSEKQINS